VYPDSSHTTGLFPSTGLVRAPEHLSDEEASCLPIVAVTAWMAINGMEMDGSVRGKGETVVCQDTRGVSISGLQIAKAEDTTGRFPGLGSDSWVELLTRQ